MADDRWRPQAHYLVKVEPDENDVSPPGTWQILSHGPGGPTAWWLMPISDDAIRWVTGNTSQTVNRCVQVPGRRLVSARKPFSR